MSTVAHFQRNPLCSQATAVLHFAHRLPPTVVLLHADCAPLVPDELLRAAVMDWLRGAAEWVQSRVQPRVAGDEAREETSSTTNTTRKATVAYPTVKRLLFHMF